MGPEPLPGATVSAAAAEIKLKLRSLIMGG